MKNTKRKAPPRYDNAFKEGAIKLVVKQGRPHKEVAKELSNNKRKARQIRSGNVSVK